MPASAPAGVAGACGADQIKGRGGDQKAAPEALAGSPGPLTSLKTDADSLARLPRELGGDARVYETDHFVFVHTAGEDCLRELSSRVEAAYRANVRLIRELGLPARRPPHKLEVLLFGTYEEFRACQRLLGSTDEEVLGFYDPAGNRSVFFDLATHPPIVRLRAELQHGAAAEFAQRRRLRRKLRRNTEALLAKVVQHEVAHQLHYNTGVLSAQARVPSWLAEGLAQMFELPFVDRDATLELSTNRYRLYEFTQLHDDATALRPALRRLIAAADQAGGGDYSLSWALTNYLYKRQRVRFGDYLRRIAARREAGDRSPAARRREFEAFFGPLDEAFVARFCGYMRRLRERCGVPEQPGRDLRR